MASGSWIRSVVRATDSVHARLRRSAHFSLSFDALPGIRFGLGSVSRLLPKRVLVPLLNLAPTFVGEMAVFGIDSEEQRSI
jgi:hypothetical protein